MDQVTEPALAFKHCKLGRTLFGHISGDFGETDELSIFDNRVDNHHCPKTAAILSDPPGFGGEAAGFGGYPQRLCGDTINALLIGIEAGEMLTDDLFSRVTFDPFSARVPTHHVPLWAEHVDGVVHHALDQQLMKIDQCHSRSI